MILPELSWAQRAEVVLVAGVLALLLFAPRLDRRVGAVQLIGLVVTVAVAACGALADSGLMRMVLLLAGVLGAVGFLLLKDAELGDLQQRPEAGALLLVGTIGAIVLALGKTMLDVAVGVELISLAGAALTAFGAGARALEAGFKYFVLTAVTFATLLFGMALVFVATGDLAVPKAGAVVEGMRWLAIAGTALFCIGLAFKLALAPVHFGALDAYTAAPASFAGFIMLSSKLGAAIALGKVATLSSLGALLPAPSGGGAVPAVLVGAGILTLAIGVVASFAQTDLRRLLAYSAVAHAGLLAVAAGSGAAGLSAARFYLMGYGAAALLAFAALSGSGMDPFPIASLADGKRLGRLRSLALLLSLASLAGVPPLPGFWAKLAVLKACFDVYGLWPTVLTALGAVLGIIYYLRPMPDLVTQVRRSETRALSLSGVAVIVLVVAVAVLGAAPGLVWGLASTP